MMARGKGHDVFGGVDTAVMHQAEQIRFLTRDNKKMREAGTKLAEAALFTAREHDGIHRLLLAVSEWAQTLANEGDRDLRYAKQADGETS